MTAIAFPTAASFARPPATRRVRSPRPSAAVYRRRRLVAFVLFVSALAGGSSALQVLGSGPLTAAEATSEVTGGDVRLSVQPVARSIYVVRSGDTIWTIARFLQPEGDVRPLVDRLMEDRAGRPLLPGEEIEIP